MKKGQYSLEYLMVLGIAMFVLITTMYFVYNQSNRLNDEVNVERVLAAGEAIVDNVEFVFPLGKDSKTTISFSSPIPLSNFTVEGDLGVGQTLIIEMDIYGQPTELLFFSAYDMYVGNCSTVKPVTDDFLQAPGQRDLVITKCGTNVSIYPK